MIGGQYLTPSCCDSFDVLGKWPLFWQKRVKGVCLNTWAAIFIWTSICMEPVLPKWGMPTHAPVTWGLKEAREALDRESTQLPSWQLSISWGCSTHNPKLITFLSPVNPKRHSTISLPNRNAFWPAVTLFSYLRIGSSFPISMPTHSQKTICLFDLIPKHWSTTPGYISPFPWENVAKLGVLSFKPTTTEH